MNCVNTQCLFTELKRNSSSFLFKIDLVAETSFRDIQYEVHANIITK